MKIAEWIRIATTVSYATREELGETPRMAFVGGNVPKSAQGHLPMRQDRTYIACRSKDGKWEAVSEIRPGLSDSERREANMEISRRVSMMNYRPD